MVNLVKFLRTKNLHEHQKETALQVSMTVKQTSKFPQAKATFSNWNAEFPKKRSWHEKNLKPVALSLLLINSKVTGRLEMKKGSGVTYSHRWKSSGLNRKGLRRVWSTNLSSSEEHKLYAKMPCP